MANKIQIKRSVANSTVTGLSNGELAFTQAGNILYIGAPDGTSGSLRIGGLQVPGTLTANQALVANSTSAIDKVIVANLVPTTVWANGGAGSAGQVLHSNGSTVYWSDTTADITSVVAGSGLTGGGTSGEVTLNIGQGNGISVSADAVAVTAGNGLVSNATGVHIVTSGDTTLIANATGLYVNDATLSIATSQLTGDVALGTQTSGNYVATITAGVGISGSSSTEGGTPTIAVVANNGISANSTGVFAVGANGVSITAAGINVTGGNGLVANTTGVHVGSGNGISVSADAIAVTGGSTLTVNATGVHVNSTLSITDLSLSGNLTVLGTLSTIDTTNLTVKDSLIELANGNVAADLLDIGLYGQYAATGTRYTGIFRDATDGIYKLFANSTVEPTTTVDTGATGYTQATLQAWLQSGGLVSNGTNISITANSTVAVAIVANTLTLSTPLAGTSGGTGKATMTSQAILVGNATNGYNELSLGADGLVLQSNGTALIYDTLDGGTF